MTGGQRQVKYRQERNQAREKLEKTQKALAYCKKRVERLEEELEEKA